MSVDSGVSRRGFLCGVAAAGASAMPCAAGVAKAPAAGDFLREPARDIPVAGRCDVLVAGGGPAGIAAAVGAARQGAKVVLLESKGSVGGI